MERGREKTKTEGEVEELRVGNWGRPLRLSVLNLRRNTIKAML